MSVCSAASEGEEGREGGRVGGEGGGREGKREGGRERQADRDTDRQKLFYLRVRDHDRFKANHLITDEYQLHHLLA